jgi:hypothetical protein
MKSKANPLRPIVIDLLNLCLALKMTQIRRGGKFAQNLVNEYDAITKMALKALQEAEGEEK